MDSIFWLVIVPSILVLLWIPYSIWVLYSSKRGRAGDDGESVPIPRPEPTRTRMSPLTPDVSDNGEWHEDGHEWLEHPQNSNVWWVRDLITGRWLRT